MVQTELRIWVDHPFNARFVRDVQQKVGVASKCARIFEGLERDGWVCEYEENDSGEILWVAHREFSSREEAVASCKKHNPRRWGSFMIDNEEVW